MTTERNTFANFTYFISNQLSVLYLEVTIASLITTNFDWRNLIIVVAILKTVGVCFQKELDKSSALFSAS